MFAHPQITRRLRLAVPLLALAAWLALPQATPVRADDTSLPLNTTLSVGRIERGDDDEYTSSVPAGRQVIIGAINTREWSIADDLTVEVDCRGQVSPRDPNSGDRNKGKSVGGAVYCRPSEPGRDVKIKVRNQTGSDTSYVIFVIATDLTQNSSLRTPNPDLQSRKVDNLSPGSIHLISLGYQAGFSNASMLLKYAPTGENRDTRMAARFYSPTDGRRTCVASIQRYSEPATAQPTNIVNASTPCAPVIEMDASLTAGYLVVINYSGGPGTYCMDLATTNQHISSSIESCARFN